MPFTDDIGDDLRIDMSFTDDIGDDMSSLNMGLTLGITGNIG